MTTEFWILTLSAVGALGEFGRRALARQRRRLYLREIQLRLEGAFETLRPPLLLGTKRWPRLPAGFDRRFRWDSVNKVRGAAIDRWERR